VALFRALNLTARYLIRAQKVILSFLLIFYHLQNLTFCYFGWWWLYSNSDVACNEMSMTKEG